MAYKILSLPPRPQVGTSANKFSTGTAAFHVLSAYLRFSVLIINVRVGGRVWVADLVQKLNAKSVTEGLGDKRMLKREARMGMTRSNTGCQKE